MCNRTLESKIGNNNNNWIKKDWILYWWLSRYTIVRGGLEFDTKDYSEMENFFFFLILYDSNFTVYFNKDLLLKKKSLRICNPCLHKCKDYDLTLVLYNNKKGYRGFESCMKDLPIIQKSFDYIYLIKKKI